MNRQIAAQTLQQKPTATPAIGGLLQRKCACGNHTMRGECEECSMKKKGMQRKLVIGSSNDPLELEADRVADLVMAMTPSRGVRSSLPRIQSVGGQATGDMGSVPASVDRVISSPGRPLEPELQQDMEQRFGYDFSQVRVHTGAEAEQSARQVHAHAYTVGNNIVFSGRRYSQRAREKRHLLAHELTHIVQQSRTNGGVSQNVVQRDPDDESSWYAVYYLPYVGLMEDVENELLRRGILKPGDYDGTILAADGYMFVKGGRWVVHAIYIRNESGDITGYKVISVLQAPAKTGGAAQGAQAQHASQGKVVTTTATPQKRKPKPKRTTTAKPPATAAPQTAKPVQKSDEEIKAELAAMPEAVKALLFDEKGDKLEHEKLPQLLRIANKLKQLQPEDLKLYKLLTKKLIQNLDAFERSVDFFIQFKKEIEAQAKTESQKKEPTLEEELAQTWSQFDESKFAGMTPQEKEDMARDIAAQQRNIQLKHMATHPGETAVGMVEGIVRVDKTAKAIAEDVKDAADGNKSGYARIAGLVGAYNKYLMAVASIVFIALLFVPGVNLVELAIAGIAVAAATIVLSAAESELRIKAAGQAKTPEELKTETTKAAAAQTQGIVAAAMLALMLVAKLVARIPLRGRYQNVGTAINAAKTALLKKSGVGPAWQAVKTNLLEKLRASKQGLKEALVEQSKPIAETAKTVGGLSGDEFVNRLAAGDPQLADLGISADQAKAVQQIAATPEGKGIPEQLRQDSLRALQDTPVEAQKKVTQFLNDVDDSIKKVEQAQNEQQLKAAVNDAEAKMSPEAQAKQAVLEEQAFVKERLESARRSSLRERATKKLEELRSEQAKTEAKIAELQKGLSTAEMEVNRLKERLLKMPRDSAERPKLLEEFNKAKEKLADIKERDELGGYREERRKQVQTEKAILESLELRRPGLWESTKAAIRKAAKKNAAGKYLDPNTGLPIKEPVYGHKYGYENRRLILKASSKGMTQEQFTEWVNKHPEWLQIEEKVNNESHFYEKPGVAGWESIE